jgi:hypothetical protein
MNAIDLFVLAHLWAFLIPEAIIVGAAGLFVWSK